MAPLFFEKGEAVSFLSDGIIVLYNVFYRGKERKRALEILKMRGADFMRKVVELEIISKKGIIVYPGRILSGEYVLT
ncbi:MAG: ATPase domain-containing protein [Nanoarchaeota archaeon]